MFNFLHSLLSNLYLTKPSVHYFQPKSLNLHFKTNLENKYIWVNLQQTLSVQPFIEQVSEEKNNFFILKVNITNKALQVSTLDVAKFETRKEAETALEVLSSKMYSPEKSLIKFSLVVISLVLLWGLIADMANVLGRKMLTPTSNQQAMVQSVPTQPQMAPNQVDIQPSAPPVQNVPMAPPANPAITSIIDGLGKPSK